MDTQEIVILVVAILVVLAIIAAIVAMMNKRKREQHEARAQEIRTEAHQQASADLPDAQVRAQKAEAEAAEARLAAQRAEQQAAEARTGVAQQEALHEDQVRHADRLDPRVDHKSDDYTPETAVPTQDSRTSDPDTVLDADDTRREAAPRTDETRSDASHLDDDGGLPRRVRGANEMPGGVPKSEWGDNWFKRNADGSPQLDADGNRIPETDGGSTPPGTSDGGSHRA